MLSTRKRRRSVNYMDYTDENLDELQYKEEMMIEAEEMEQSALTKPHCNLVPHNCTIATQLDPIATTTATALLHSSFGRRPNYKVDEEEQQDQKQEREEEQEEKNVASTNGIYRTASDITARKGAKQEETTHKEAKQEETSTEVEYTLTYNPQDQSCDNNDMEIDGMEDNSEENEVNVGTIGDKVAYNPQDDQADNNGMEEESDVYSNEEESEDDRDVSDLSFITTREDDDLERDADFWEESYDFPGGCSCVNQEEDTSFLSESDHPSMKSSDIPYESDD